MNNTVNRQWCLAARPVGPVKESDFDFVVAPKPDVGPGQILIRSKYLSVAPVMRLYMIDGAGIEKPVGIGEVMLGRGVGEIVESKNDAWPVGTIVQGKLGWQDYALADGSAGSLMYKVTQRVAPISTALGALGMTGFTAYCSLKDIGQVQPGETVVVSGAMGGVGSIAVQVARLMGGRVVGIAGTAEKCRRLVETLGCAAAINYREESISEALTVHAPDGVDIFFDNVGGPVLDDVLEHINRYARIISCGHISEYLSDDPYRLRNWAEVGGKRAKLEGFFVYDYEPMFPEAEQAMAQWIADDKLHYEEDVLEGLEAMPKALIRLYDGQNVGKQIVHVA